MVSKKDPNLWLKERNLWDFLVFLLFFFLTGTAAKYSQPATWILGRLILLLDVSWNLCIPNPSWWRFLKEEWCFLGGGFKYFSFSPRTLGKMSNLTIIFFRWVDSTNQFCSGGFRTCYPQIRPGPPAFFEKNMSLEVEDFFVGKTTPVSTNSKLVVWDSNRVFGGSSQLVSHG